jgi:peptide/nickel transport system permease protein
MMAFLLLRIIPGDPALVKLAGETGDSSFTQAELHDLQVKLGTDRPLYVQYGKWVWGMLRLDFGESMFFEEPVAEDLAAKFPITLELTVLAMLIATIIAVPLGLVSAIKQDTPADYIARIISITGVALPNFWVGILIVYFLVLFFAWMPPLGYANLWEDPATNLQQFIFPALALGFFEMAFTARVTRSSMLEVYREDYTRTARGKGLAERVVILRHALKNALLPVVTVTGFQFGRLLAGTVVIENIFMVPGMGKLLLDSVFHRDYTEVQAIVVLITVSVLILNLLLDLVYGWLNPRIRYS